MLASSTIWQQWQRKRKQYLYFTLIELLVVVAIIAILAGLLISSILDANCRSKIIDLLAILDAIKADITGATTSGPATDHAAAEIGKKMDDALIKFKAAKKAKCLDAEDKKQINTKIQECIQLIVQIKDSQNDKVKELLEGIIQKLTGEKFPD